MSTPNFMEILFPTNVSLGAIGGTGWSTRVVVTDGGNEYRQQLWGYSRGKWTVGHNLRTAAEWAQLITFHRLAAGKTLGFRFQDWSDYTDGGGGTVTFNASIQLQLAKLYAQVDIITGDPWVNLRLISKPVPGTIQLFLNGTPHTLGTGGSIDYTTGVITLGAGDPPEGPGDIYTWTGQFHVPVRFDTDTPEISMDLPTAAGWKGIPLIELRIPGQ
jgi:uncharacterized protein (TIGR02217 family)